MKRMTMKKMAAGLSSALVMASAMPLSSVPVMAAGETSSDIIYGDADCDGKVYLNDAVLIMQAIGNPDAYGVNGTEKTHITEQGKINADVSNTGDDLTNADALTIQKYLLHIIDKLPA